MRDLVLAVRADEACHSHVNHVFAGLKGEDPNPFSADSNETV
jgi:Alternative oxidase